ncbi:hypothetical protein, variant [Aphanomyces invadans]|uniref:Uncharacterized protein n=1 Tax=Aphanomyces invadans TaxID=157072 RepID=A0A024TIG5_9STRA|nr:hypothetical protein, variant [Aphanomyces invadans]ETV93920.1 hypothetical protein, variant [Aphanomyces invadans]|eukprot:XP_008877479.1 hypothetical protein, variant [Aphanomyces invadans]
MMMRSDHILADLRTSQDLEPLRVPEKLQDRFERAHKRMANKDGYLFTSAATPPRESAKKNLPEVIVRNKMMAFESKWQCTSKTSMLYDPLDTSFERLSMDEREEVMNRIQTRVEHITDVVGDKYRRKKQELDEHGVFDPAINARRVQTMYLVELQRRCNIDQLKTQVLEEFDRERQPLFAGSFGQKTSSSAAPVHVLGTLLQEAEPPLHQLKGSKKLQRMLRSPSMAKSSSEPVLERRKSIRSSSIASSIGTKGTPTTSATLPVDSSGPPPVPPNNPVRSSHADNNPKHIAMSRHPEIALVVAALRVAEADANVVKTRTKVSLRPGQDMAAKPNTAVDEWKDQVDLFGQIGARCSASLRRRLTCELADFSAVPPSFTHVWNRIVPLTTSLRERRAKSKSAVVRTDHPNQATTDIEPVDRLSARKAAANARYSQWQDAIGRRRKQPKHVSDSASVVSTGAPHPTIPTTEPNVATAPPSALERRPSTILNERQNKHACRQKSVATGIVGCRPRVAAPLSQHTTKRVLRRQVTAITWEWQALEATKEASVSVSPNADLSTAAALLARPSGADDSPLGSSRRSREKISPNRSSTLSAANIRNNSVVDCHETLQTRLEEVWLRLGMPYHLKLKMLQKYASHDGAELLHTAIDLWEAAAEVVVMRETLLTMQAHVDADLVPDELEIYWSQLQTYQLHLPIPSDAPPMHAFGPWVESLVPIATAKCKDAIHALAVATGDALTYDGAVYLVDDLEGDG